MIAASRLRRLALPALVVLLVGACAGATGTAGRSVAAATGPDAMRELISVLAADSLEGRATGSPGAMRAARYIAEQFRAVGLEPLGDSGFYQKVPLRATVDRRGLPSAAAVASWAAWDSLPAEQRRPGVNVVGVLRGAHPTLRDEYVLVDAHYDHLGIGRPVNGDSIFNGADDDASGVAAVIAIARAMATGPRPQRSLVFLATTGEEVGLVGTRWYIAHPPVPLAQTVSNLEIEMIGRPDSLAGGVGRAWLTGYDRSTMGDILRAAGVAIVADPRPAQNFFERSDNIAFARLGIPAHTLSSFNLHRDYHTPADDVTHMDFEHVARVVGEAARAVRLLADGPVPQWKPNGRPAAPAPRP
jgi:hypothetical protein